MRTSIPLVADIGLTTRGSALVIFIQPKDGREGRDWCRRETLNPAPDMLHSNVIYAVHQWIRNPA
jgi:hypothetical protein